MRFLNFVNFNFPISLTEYFGSVAEIDAVFNFRLEKEPQDQADALFLFYNCLLVVNTCKQYLRLDRHHINVIARYVTCLGRML